MRAQGDPLPSLTRVKLRPPDTGTGVVLLVAVPLPSEPYVLFPQQYAAFAVVTPQVPPTALTDANASPPTTASGVVLLVVSPLPSSPNWFNPQQYAAPPVTTPQVW